LHKEKHSVFRFWRGGGGGGGGTMGNMGGTGGKGADWGRKGKTAYMHCIHTCPAKRQTVYFYFFFATLHDICITNHSFI